MTMRRPGRLHFSMMNANSFRLIFLAALLVLPLAVAAAIDTPHYRVEVIVFSHADGRPDGRSSGELEDFSALVDPLQRVRVASAPPATDDSRPEGLQGNEPGYDQDRQAEVDAVLDVFDTLSGLEEGSLMPEIPTWPESWLALDSLSSKMDRARARLHESPQHEVLAWRAWYQPLARGRSTQPVRIHDEYVVAADWLKVLPVGKPVPTPGNDDAGQLEPRLHYRLDGSIRLRQRQFMHIESDLHWRIPASSAPSPWLGAIDAGPEADGDVYDVHRLAQNRTVRPGRLEYFDSAWLGMLVLIEPLEPLDGSDVEFDFDDSVPADD